MQKVTEDARHIAHTQGVSRMYNYLPNSHHAGWALTCWKKTLTVRCCWHVNLGKYILF